MTRGLFIERIIEQIYNGQVTDDAVIDEVIVNQWLSDAIAAAAKQNYKDNLQLEGVAYNNSSFFSTYKGIPITEDESFLFKFAMPSLPLGIGSIDGISRAVIKSKDGDSSYPIVILTEDQVGVQRGMRTIQRRMVGYPEGINFFVFSSVSLVDCTASITMISNGEGSDLTSQLNVPSDYFGMIVEYIKANLAFERAQVVNVANDGTDNVRTA